MRIPLWTLLIVLVTAPMATAHDLLPPAWRGQPGTSVFEYDNSWYTPDYFSSYDNTLAPPEIYYESGWNYWNGLRFGLPGYGWYLPWSSQHSRLIFGMDNYDNNRPRKDIRVQVTFYAPDFYNYYGPWSLRVWAASDEAYTDPLFSWDGSTDIAYSAVNVVPGYGGWMCAAFDMTLTPNPDKEVIGLDFGTYWPWWYDTSGNWVYQSGGRVWIDQVVIDTRCVPEPATLCFLVLGGLSALLLRRRRAA